MNYIRLKIIKHLPIKNFTSLNIIQILLHNRFLFIIIKPQSRKQFKLSRTSRCIQLLQNILSDIQLIVINFDFAGEKTNHFRAYCLHCIYTCWKPYLFLILLLTLYYPFLQLAIYPVLWRVDMILLRLFEKLFLVYL